MNNLSFIAFILIFLLIIKVSAQTQDKYCEKWGAQKNILKDSDSKLRFNQQMVLKVDDLCKMKIYMNSAFIMYESKRNVDSSLYYNNKAIQIGIDIGEEELLAKAYSNKADAYLLNNQYDKAIDNLSKSRKILNNNPDTESWIFYYQSYSELYDNQSNFIKALKYTDSAISVSKRTHNDIELAVCYHNKGLHNYRLSRYEEAIKNILLAINLKENQEEPDGIARTYYLLGNCYVKWRQYETAEKYLNKSIPFAEKEGNDFLLILNYSYLTECYLEMKNIDKAIEFTDKALALAKKIKSNERIFQGLIQKGWIYFKNEKRYDLAEKFFKEAYSITNLIEQEKNQYLFRCYHALIQVYIHQGAYNKAAQFLIPYEKVVKNLNMLSDTRDMHKTFSEYYEKTKQYGLALEHQKKHFAINDSISNQEVQTKIADLEKKYDTKKKELAIVNLNKEKEQQQLMVEKAKAQQILYLLAAVFLLLLLVLGAWAFRKLKKQQKELLNTNQIKNRLFSIIAHDLRGMIIPFQRSGKILKYHIDKGNHQKTIELSQTLEKNSESLSNMLDNLLNWSLEQMNGYKMHAENISVSEELNKIIEGYRQQAVYKKTKIELKYIEDVSIYMDKGAFHVIFRNLIGNALKYTEEGSIRIEFKKENSLFLCSVVDTGIGMNSEQLENLFTLEEKKSTIGTQGEKGTGLGLNLVYRFIKMHKGTINVSSEKRIGTRFNLSFQMIENQLKKKSEQKSISA